MFTFEGGNLSPSNLQQLSKRNSAMFGSKKSSFSKKSSRSVDLDENSEMNEALSEKGYLYRINGDFDSRKGYEECVLKIMNEKPLTRITEPEGHGLFGEKYAKTSKHKRTLFIDLDDTLIYVSPFKLDTLTLKTHEIEIQDGTSKKMKVIPVF
jgi:hypothetical protein